MWSVWIFWKIIGHQHWLFQKYYCQFAHCWPIVILVSDRREKPRFQWNKCLIIRFNLQPIHLLVALPHNIFKIEKNMIESPDYGLNDMQRDFLTQQTTVYSFVITCAMLIFSNYSAPIQTLIRHKPRQE